MTGSSVEWLAPRSLEEAQALRAERGSEATVVAGGTFLGILLNQGLLEPSALLSLRDVDGLAAIDAAGAELRLGAMVTHRAVERHPEVRRRWPVLAHAFGLVASPRVRNQATVGGVLADADYASDPPAVLTALDARAVLRSPRGEREVRMDELILGFYETCIADDELLTQVRVPAVAGAAVYRKFRSRSTEDRPCVAVAAAHAGGALRVVVGALADGRPLDGALAEEIGGRYAERIQPLDDARGTAAYRRRVTAVEVRRALEQLAAGPRPGGDRLEGEAAG